MAVLPSGIWDPCFPICSYRKLPINGGPVKNKMRIEAPVISAVIPALNAAATLPGTVAALGGAVAEIVVADGGSTDGTPAVARGLGATVVEAPRGRGSQIA